MGLSTKQVSGDNQGLTDWGTAELPNKPPSVRRHPPLQPEPLKCPRCSSTNTKFCYYNNYNKSQPRHFCKSCKRHWTKGGTLRNVPVGGARKNKRPKISNSNAAVEIPASTASGQLRRQSDRAIFLSSSAANYSGDRKTMCDILNQAILRSSSSTLLHEAADQIGANTYDSLSTGLNISSAPEIINRNEEFQTQFSSLISTFDTNATNFYQPLNALFDHYNGNLDSNMEESTITTVNIPSTSGATLPGPDTNLELPSYWNWNEIDVLNSADLNKAWDDGGGDAEIKP